jgi:hypothetical protein
MLDLGGGGVSVLGWDGLEGEKVGVGGGESVNMLVRLQASVREVITYPLLSSSHF